MEGFFIFVLIVVLLVRWIVLHNRLRRMEDNIMELRAHLNALRPPAPAMKPAWAPVPSPSPAPTAAPVSEPVVQPIVVRPPEPAPIPVAPPPMPQPEPVFVPPAFTRPEPAPQAAREDWEAQLGGNWLNKAGVLVLVIGIALLLGYSFTHLGPAGIVGISLTGSVAMLLAGVRLEPRERYRIFARGLISGGWAAIYVTVYSMHSVAAARVIENPYLGTLMLMLVAVGMIGHSLVYREEVVTGLAYFIAFFTLAITQAGSLPVLALVPLAASLLYLSHRFQWRNMALGGLIATYGTCVARGDSGSALWEAQAVFAIFWLLYEAYDIVQGDTWLMPLNAVGFLGLSLLKWNTASPGNEWKLAAVAAGAYVVSALLRARGGKWHGAVTVAAGLAAAAIFQRLGHPWVAPALVVEAELFYLAGLRLKSPYLRWLGTGLFAVETCQLLQDTQFLRTSQWEPVAAVQAVLFYINRFLAPQDIFLGYAAAGLMAMLIGAEAPVGYRGPWWLAAAAVMFAVGYLRRLPDFRRHGYLLGLLGLLWIGFFELQKVPLTVAAVLTYAVALLGVKPAEDRMSEQERLAVRFLGSLASGMAVAALLWRVAPPADLGIAWFGAAVLLSELGTMGWPAEMSWFACGMGALASIRVMAWDFPALTNHGPLTPRLLPAASGLAAYWLAFRTRRVTPGVSEAAVWVGTAFLSLSVWAVAPHDAVAACWAMFGAVLLAMNFLPQGCGLAMLAYGWWVVDLLDRNGASLPSQVFIGCGAAIACFYGAQFLSKRDGPVRLLHSLMATSLTALLLYCGISGGVLTIAWGIQGLALLAAGFPARDRVLRLSGLALLLFCILKLFFYDLRNLETLPRICSFLVLGLILLGVSWIYTRFRDRVARYL